VWPPWHGSSPAKQREWQHRKGKEQDRKIEGLEATVSRLQATLIAQAAQIQQVSDRHKTHAPVSRVEANN